MTNLPTGFEDWQEDAQQHFLLQARSRVEIFALILDELDMDIENDITSGNGYISKKALIETYHASKDE